LTLKQNFIFIFLTLCLVILFQNCGQEYSPTVLYGLDGQASYNSRDCISDVVDCGPRVEFLQISIDTPNPLVLSSSRGSYLISGRCNVGNYPEHYLVIEVKNSSGTSRLNQRLGNICIQGKYEFLLPLTSFAVNENHNLVVYPEGIDEEGTTYNNTRAGGSAQIDFYRQ
jgi:hypothetical protein